MQNVYQQLNERFPDLEWQQNVPLAEKTYFKIGGTAETLLQTDNREALQEIIPFCHEHNIPITIMGGASNVLVADDGIRGLVLQFTGKKVEKISENELEAEAGLQTALLVRKSIDHGMMGLEYFLGVPGVIGGAIYNNAHYLEHLIGQYITSVTTITNTGQIQTYSHDECDFAYDYSIFQKNDDLIISARFKLKPLDEAQSKKDLLTATQYRATTQPLGVPSSGCIFQNVPNTPALQTQFPQFKNRSHVGGGFLIDQAGLKGRNIGGVSVSTKHAAFFVNDGTGTEADVKALVDVVKKTVKEKFGVELHEEVFYLQ